tara:strand:- start:2745 stop:4322 length:1578 start_codon:yes stop_codon:yes gene_type:complete
MAGGDWTPSELGTSILTAWYKADSISGSDGDAVAAWSDSSGNGNDTSQSVAVRQPTLQTNELNGQPTVRFDGTNDILSDSDIAALDVGTGDVWMACLLKSTDDSGVQDYFEKGHQQFGLSCLANGDLRICMGSTTNGPVQTSGNWSRTNFVLVTGSRVSNNNNGFVDGSPMNVTNTTDNGSISNSNVFDIGSRAIGAGPMVGDIAEVLVGGATLTTANREKVEGYLAWKYGLQTNLPDDHTYRFHKPKIDPIVWTGDRGTSLDVALNWSGGVVPSATDKVLFNTGNVDATTGSLTAGSVFITDGYTGNIGTSSSPRTFTADEVVIGSSRSNINIQMASNTKTFVTESANGVNLSGSSTNLFVRSKDPTTLGLTTSGTMNIDVRHPSGNGGLCSHTSGVPFKTTVGFGGAVKRSVAASGDTLEVTGNGSFKHTTGAMPEFTQRGGNIVFNGTSIDGGVCDLIGGVFNINRTTQAVVEMSTIDVYPGGLMDLTGPASGQVDFGVSKVLRSVGGSRLKLGSGRSAAMS